MCEIIHAGFKIVEIVPGALPLSLLAGYRLLLYLIRFAQSVEGHIYVYNAVGDTRARENIGIHHAWISRWDDAGPDVRLDK